MKSLLIIDDEPAIARVIQPVLVAEGWQVSTAISGAHGLRLAAQNSVDIVLLDLGLPDIDGKELIPSLRRLGRLAIIIISARHQEAEKVLALDAGADDYVDKPFNIQELSARIRAAERRLQTVAGSSESYEVGALSLNVPARHVELDGTAIKLSPKEFDLLRELMAHSGQVVTHRRLLLTGWGNAQVDQQYLRSYIALLRQKLEEDSAEPQLILSEPGVGYRLRSKDYGSAKTILD